VSKKVFSVFVYVERLLFIFFIFLKFYLTNFLLEKNIALLCNCYCLFLHKMARKDEFQNVVNFILEIGSCDRV
jgi:hypothetical protein